MTTKSKTKPAPRKPAPRPKASPRPKAEQHAEDNLAALGVAMDAIESLDKIQQGDLRRRALWLVADWIDAVAPDVTAEVSSQSARRHQQRGPFSAALVAAFAKKTGLRIDQMHPKAAAEALIDWMAHGGLPLPGPSA